MLPFARRTPSTLPFKWHRIAGTLIGIIIAIVVSIFSQSPPAKAAPNSNHGLTGSYYTTNLPVDEFGVPQPVGRPEATRADSQIAFGQNKGFHDPQPGRSADWAAQTGLAANGVGWLRAVIWRGSIHLPKAGTYFFATASDGSSAVYMNQSRVALNGLSSHYGRLLTSDYFSYDQADVQDFVQNVRGTPFATRRQDAYVVPIAVDGPRDLPIEVRYSGDRSEQTEGIDLFWVTPDSPKDNNGKPVAKLVPPEVLEAATPAIEAPGVRSANSTIAADLYCSGVKESKPLTLTFRLANKDGQPVAGKRVFFTTLADEDFGFDETIQADKPTDQNGITTAQLKSRPDARPHKSSIYATDVTDLVDIGQVGHVKFVDVQPGFFASPCTDGFDPNLITVEPLPMVAGRPLTLKVKLENRQKSDVDLDATFQATDWNIGANTWKDVGRVDNIRLKAGESKDVSVTWTPTAEQVHQCFRVQVKQNATANKRTMTRTPIASALPVETVVAFLQADPDSTSGGSVQRNVGPVAGCSFDPANGLTEADRQAGIDAEELASEDVGSVFPNEAGHCKPNLAQKLFCKKWAGRDPSFLCRRALADKDPNQQAQDARGCNAEMSLYKSVMACYNDPADPRYRGLAVADSDDLAAYLRAFTHSMERYQGAQAAGDQQWMTKHATAIALYEKQIAASLRKRADELQKNAQNAPAEDASTVAADQAAFNDLLTALRANKQFPENQRAILRNAGLSDRQIGAFADLLVRQRIPTTVTAIRDFAAENATALRAMAEQAESLAAGSSTGRAETRESGEGGLEAEGRYVQTFNVNNPHDRTEDVRLLVEPMAIPSAWKLSVVNAEQLAAPSPDRGGKAPTSPQPQFPIHEVTSGREYLVTLPAKQQIKVASVVVPVGELGANTTARWAVQGMIGSEVIGTMVHELNVPYIIADMNLPAPGSKEEVEAGPATNQNRRSYIVEIAAAIAAAIILILFFWLRRRRTGA